MMNQHELARDLAPRPMLRVVDTLTVSREQTDLMISRARVLYEVARRRQSDSDAQISMTLAIAEAGWRLEDHWHEHGDEGWYRDRLAIMHKMHRSVRRGFRDVGP